MANFIEYFTPPVLEKIDELFTHVMLGSSEHNFDRDFLLQTHALLDQNLDDWMIASSAEEMHFLHVPPTYLERFFKVYFIMNTFDEDATFETLIVRLWAVAPHLVHYPSYNEVLDKALIDNLPTLAPDRFQQLVGMMALITTVFARDYEQNYLEHLEHIAKSLDKRTSIRFVTTLFEHLFATYLNHKDYLSFFEQQVPDYAQAAIRRIESLYPNHAYHIVSEHILSWNLFGDHQDPSWSNLSDMNDTVKYLITTHVARTATKEWSLSESEMKAFFQKINLFNISLIENFIDLFGDKECKKAARNGSSLTFLPPATETTVESPLHF